MKRFSAREFALLCVPVAAVAGAGWWASRRGAPTNNGMTVIAARKFAVTPAVASKGGNVMARIELKPESPGFLRTSQALNWNADFRLRAGERLVWSKSATNTKPDVTVWWLESPNAYYLYEAGFDLNKVPADWGEVVLEWDAELKQSGRDLGRDWKRKSQRTGSIVLRRAGETIDKPIVSTNSHLKLVSSEIELTPPSSGAVFYQVILRFEPDSALTRDDLSDINFDFTLRNPKTKLLSGSYGPMGIPIPLSVNPVRYVYEVQHDISDAKGHPNTRLDWKANSRTYWPLTGTLPVTDAKGKILLGKKQYH